jgi:ATP adenylyltransferase
MKRLWAPWRVKYVTGLDKKTKGCVFCRILKEKTDKKNFVFKRSKYTYGVFNIYPYNNGHVLIVANRHVSDLVKLSGEEKQDLFGLLEFSKAILQKVLKPTGFNIGINIGRVAGAGFPGHIHIHLVPRWKGDVNFMPVTANTKIVSQSIRVLYQKVKECVQEKKSKH